ncbi:MAG: hypothetical protein ACOCWJ_06295, partial [Verrucomicrobiota bacterium]
PPPFSAKATPFEVKPGQEVKSPELLAKFCVIEMPLPPEAGRLQLGAAGFGRTFPFEVPNSRQVAEPRLRDWILVLRSIQ